MSRESMSAEKRVAGTAGGNESEPSPGAAGAADLADGGRRPTSRRRFLGRTAAGTAAAGLLASAPGAAGAAVPQLYPSENRRIFQEILNNENSHANFLVGALGGNARPRPVFMNLVAANANQFVAMAYNFENIGARAYTAALPYINNPATLSGAIRIALVEGRHAGYLSALLNQPLVPADLAFETPMSQQEAINDTAPFLASLNGGSTPAYDLGRSDQNDIQILNFALYLEFLESQFYNINVPRFFA